MIRNKFIGWIIIGIIAISIISSLIQILIPFVYLLLIIVAILCIYGLLPPQFRLAKIERWLSEKETRKTTATPESKPAIDFNRFANFSPNNHNRLPDREELKAYLRSKIIGQDEAINSLVRVVLGKLAAKNNPKPLVVFLPGPTGVGKTELSKSLADALNSNLTRFDMGEFSESHKASNLFGSAKGYLGSEDGGALPNALRNNKNSCIVILFDEVEKASQTLWQSLLAFFDEGRVKDTLGQAIAPKNTICILTSNIEAEKIAKSPETAKDIIKESGYFPPEFLGRIDKIIPLLRLNPVDTAKLTYISAQRIAHRYDIILEIDEKILNELMQFAHEEAQKYGGRGIMEKISDLLLDDLIDLQTEGVSQAKLIIKNSRLTAVPIQFQSR